MPLDTLLGKGVRRLFLFWTPASGYDWGHAYHCLEVGCPDPNPRDIFFFAPELAVPNPIPTIDDADQSDDQVTIGGSASSGTSSKRSRRSDDNEDAPGMCGESGICQWGYVNLFAFNS